MMGAPHAAHQCFRPNQWAPPDRPTACAVLLLSSPLHRYASIVYSPPCYMYAVSIIVLLYILIAP
jgi:hypothetical protein